MIKMGISMKIDPKIENEVRTRTGKYLIYQLGREKCVYIVTKENYVGLLKDLGNPNEIFQASSNLDCDYLILTSISRKDLKQGIGNKTYKEFLLGTTEKQKRLTTLMVQRSLATGNEKKEIKDTIIFYPQTLEEKLTKNGTLDIPK